MNTNIPYSNDNAVLLDGLNPKKLVPHREIEHEPLIDQRLMDAAVDDRAEVLFRSEAMAAALTFVEEGDYSQDALTALVTGLAGCDTGLAYLSNDQQECYDDLMTMTADALVSLGANADNIREFIESSDPNTANEAGSKIGKFLRLKLLEEEVNEDEVIARFAIAPQLLVESAAQVLRNGRVPLTRKALYLKQLTGVQKLTVEKAQIKAHGAFKRLWRAKVAKRRKSRGM